MPPDPAMHTAAAPAAPAPADSVRDRVPVAVVGIGAEGWGGLPENARQLVRGAQVLMGSDRQLDLVPADIMTERVSWPSPLLPALPGLIEMNRHRRICVLASGDPMLFGIGATLVRLLGADAVHIVPHVSSVSLACARLGWPVQETELVSVVGRPVELVHPLVQPGRRFLVLGADGGSPAAVAALLTVRGFGGSRLTVLARLGAPNEHRHTGIARDWPGEPVDPLHILAIECQPQCQPRCQPECPPDAEVDARLLPTVPGLPDDAYDHDGQLTKREIRAVTLARLAPVPGQLLWDVGAGAGSIAIEWMRTHRSCRAVAIEGRADRAACLAGNAGALGVPGLRIVTGRAPAALAGLSAPDAVFVGGGATVPGVIQGCWDALRPGGRLVVNAVTLETEVVVADWYGRLGGDLTRLAVSRASPVGGFTGWRSMMPVTQWAVTKTVQT